MPSRAARAPLSFIEFQMPELASKPPAGSEWIHEIKYDGYRTEIVLDGGKARAYTRRGYDWTERYPSIVEAVEKLPARSAIIDGEAVVLGAMGRPDFQALERELGKRPSKIIYYAFDLLRLDGRDLRSRPLIDRKAALQKLLESAESGLVYSDHLKVSGEQVFEHACRLGLEGIVSKRVDAPYRSGRSETWRKVKCSRSDTFPIVAFVEKLGAHPRRVASLYIGRQQDGRLIYAGKVGTGYTLTSARQLREILDPLIQTSSPLSHPIDKPKATWVQPVVLAEVGFSGETDRGVLREAVYKGLRQDLAPLPRKPAAQSKPRGAGSTHGVPRENILQLLPDAVVPSKDELRAYWRKVARRALDHLAQRPLKLVRHTHGITFFHRGPLPEIPPSVHQLHIQKREGGEGVRVWIDDLDGLLGLVEMDAVELHPWNATVNDIEHADRLVLDVDPGEGIEWDQVIQTTLRLRDLLQEAGLASWPKLTGGKGIHLMAPFEKRLTHDAARKAARAVAQRLLDERPDLYVLSAAPSARTGHIFLDYLRNGRGNTAVGAWSPRARHGFPIAAPVTWAQVESGIQPDVFTMTHALRRGRRAA
ncbi:DNA ligase D [Mesorhizobium sp. BAC0120]|uniref:DNA ligase D n=1 Tax=Mesorhizobium sp. BAC0120 TaxID=3090670 RepID=UPI00298D1AF8|nr:DNA ligase D [Mesorhizobium sp. BAC0120]MDW6026395.1 DNA ligase D [Mesorhizobium sp. BAC0120]